MPERLADHTTLRLGGPARDWVRASSADEVVDAVRRCDQTGEPVLVLAGGSNVVVADEGFAGTVVEGTWRDERTIALKVTCAGETVLGNPVAVLRA